MAQVTLGGNPVEVAGSLPQTGESAPDFTLTNGDMADVSLSQWQGKRKVLNIIPSIDTGVCAASTGPSMKRQATWTIPWFWLSRRTCRLPRPVSAGRKG